MSFGPKSRSTSSNSPWKKGKIDFRRRSQKAEGILRLFSKLLIYFNAVHLHLQPGIRGLYAGTVPSLVANVAENAVLFLAYGAAQNLVSRGVGKQQKELNTLENACAGSLASIVSGEY